MSDPISSVALKDQTTKLLYLIEVEEFWPRTYSTTALLLLVIHVLFLYHVLSRKSRSKSLVSYRTLVRRKQYYRALAALLSHPPTRIQPTRETPSQYNTSESSAGLLFLFRRIRDRQRASVVFNGKRLSGLPLLFYNSFILWNCRSLEPMAGSFNYARLLWGLTVVALVLDLLFTHYVLSFVRDMNYGTSSPFVTGANWASRRSQFGSRGTERVKRILTRRTIGSLTSLAAAILAVFQDRFPFVPLPIFPFVSTRIPLLSNPAFSYALCLGVLSLLSHPVHPFAGIVCGTVSGMLWASDVTSFLMEPYWSSGTLVVYGLLCVLSLKASGSIFVLCIDQVPWDSDGNMIYTHQQGEESSEQRSFTLDSSSHSELSTQSTLEDNSERPQATLPLFSLEEDEIEHRLPFMGGMSDDEDNLDGGTNREYYPLVAQNDSGALGPSNGNYAATVRSRRAPRP